ncbi:MAG: hypothetical protein WDO73_08535 [Ignavibacteriota bacterium]
MLIAVAIAGIVNHFFTASVSAASMIAGVALSVSVGLFFGI